MTNKKRKLLLIDANSFIHRSFHALPPLTTDQGKPTGALYGLANTLLKVLGDESPDFVVAAFDTPEDTFRKEMFEEYKAHRPETPDELKSQIVEAHDLFDHFGIKTMEKPGFEADDVIGTIVEKTKDEKDMKTLILTGDLDTLQLVRDGNVVVLTPKRGVSNMTRYDRAAIEERFGVPPEKLADYKGLVGDSSDNIPGVEGIGKKTAAKILQKYGSLEKACEEIEKEEDLNHRIKKLAENKDIAVLSKKLAIIEKQVPIDIKLKDLKYTHEDQEDLINYFKNMGFQTLVNRLSSKEKEKVIEETDFENVELIISESDLLNKDEGFLQSDKIKVTHNWKPLIKKLHKKNKEIAGPLFDIKIAAWLLDPDQKKLSLETLAKKFLNKKPKLLSSQSENKETLRELYSILSKKLKKRGLEKVFNNIESPLINVLARMEEWGIKINQNTLEDIKEKVDKKIENIKNKIYEKAGKEFNLNSPKQIGEILFEDIGIESPGKTSSGQHKTSEEVLSEIKDKHPIIKLILEYRKFYKISSTYIEPFLEVARGKEEIHTTFLQTATGTGRLSSQSPNMQNIPKGSKWAKALRKSFVARSGLVFLSFDYSQLELRLMAHVSQDENMIKAFKKGQDIHKLTASKVLDKPIKKVTKKDRELAKTLNFGVVFGMGARAFSKQSGLSYDESKEFIKKYFEDFSGVKKWQDKIKEEAKVNGYVKNENGRRRIIKGGGYMDRAAINMPIQSLGADIIKIAMINVFDFLKVEGLLGGGAKMLLSIHDELLLEVESDNLKNIVPRIKNILEKESYSISVPLEVDAQKGKNWGNMKNLSI